MRLLAVIVVLAFAVGASADDWTDWQKHSTHPYYWRVFRYQQDNGKKAHVYGIYYPAMGKRTFLYDPVSQKYFARHDGDGLYSVLPSGARKASLMNIPVDDWPVAGRTALVAPRAVRTFIPDPPDPFPKD